MTTNSPKKQAHIDAAIYIQESNDKVVGTFANLGITVQGNAIDDLRRRAQEMLNFITTTFQQHYTFDDFCAYLDKHQMKYQIVHLEPDKPEPIYFKEVATFA